MTASLALYDVLDGRARLEVVTPEARVALTLDRRLWDRIDMRLFMSRRLGPDDLVVREDGTEVGRVDGALEILREPLELGAGDVAGAPLDLVVSVPGLASGVDFHAHVRLPPVQYVDMSEADGDPAAAVGGAFDFAGREALADAAGEERQGRGEHAGGGAVESGVLFEGAGRAAVRSVMSRPSPVVTGRNQAQPADLVIWTADTGALADGVDALAEGARRLSDLAQALEGFLGAPEVLVQLCRVDFKSDTAGGAFHLRAEAQLSEGARGLLAALRAGDAHFAAVQHALEHLKSSVGRCGDAKGARPADSHKPRVGGAEAAPCCGALSPEIRERLEAVRREAVQ